MQDHAEQELSRPPRPHKKKAWTYVRPSGPGINQLGTADGRRRFFRYHVTGNIKFGVSIFMHYAMRLLPIDACSNLGAALAERVFSYNKIAGQRARDTLRHIAPEKSDAEREAIWSRNQRNQGRLITEFSVLPRLWRHPDRVTLHNFENLTDTVRAGPTIITGLHLGNWEILHRILQGAGISAVHIYMPPSSRVWLWVAERIRRQGGTRLLPPGKDGIPGALKELKAGGVLLMYVDEGFRGRIRSPLLGRAPNLEGNLGNAIRLARMTGAKICPWYNVRRDSARFDCYFLPPIDLPPEPSPRSRLLDDVALLNAVVEPIILNHLDEWYFLDNEFVPDKIGTNSET